MKSKQKLTFALMLALLCSPAVAASAVETQLFYRGDFDDHKVEAANGAIVLDSYRDFLADGVWGKT